MNVVEPLLIAALFFQVVKRNVIIFRCYSDNGILLPKSPPD